MNITIRVLLTGIVLFLIDLYFFQAIVTILKGTAASRRNTVYYIYWGFTALSMLFLVTVVLVNYINLPPFIRVYVFSFFLLIIICKIIGSVFLATDDLIRLFRWIWSYLIKTPASETREIIKNPHAVSRLQFLNYIALGMAALPFASFIYGMVKGAFNYTIHSQKVILPQLPSAFNGIKIVQISDIHLGSFISTEHVEKAIEIVLKQKPDLILFTGDLVNNRADETLPFIDVLSKLKAPHGVYSVLGNHDYGDYVSWDTPEAKDQNLHDLKQAHAKFGWRLLQNEHVSIKRGDAEIALLGIENWGGQMHFPKYGNMKQAYAGTEKYPVKLLLSHDPSHWSMQVIKDYKDIDITFSGHTHGFQFGIELPGFKWSPSQYIYKQWAGFYTEENQHLYVNRGLGFLGYPGRVGIMPEITVMQIYNS